MKNSAERREQQWTSRGEDRMEVRDAQVEIQRLREKVALLEEELAILVRLLSSGFLEGNLTDNKVEIRECNWQTWKFNSC